MKSNYSHNFAISKKGHDAKTVYVILAEENGYVYLADGKHRRVSSPKKKKKKHIICVSANKLSEYISEETPITDGRLRRAIRAFTVDNEATVERIRSEIEALSREEE